ncbi:MAG: prepilin-type cleavage/methylation protein [Francisellaceae bacterium]|nr:prepilin-type cleavage/methylation protein [Francisellaceae bacterium]
MLKGFTHKNQGFTKIEIIGIVVVLVLILGVAIPAINNYFLKSRITELFSSVEIAKRQVSESILSKTVDVNHPSFPADNASAGINSPRDLIWGNKIQSLMVNNGVITVVSNSENLGIPLTITLTPSLLNGKVIWNCISNGDRNIMPLSCR